MMVYSTGRMAFHGKFHLFFRLCWEGNFIGKEFHLKLWIFSTSQYVVLTELLHHVLYPVSVSLFFKFPVLHLIYTFKWNTAFSSISLRLQGRGNGGRIAYVNKSKMQNFKHMHSHICLSNIFIYINKKSKAFGLSICTKSILFILENRERLPPPVSLFFFSLWSPQWEIGTGALKSG